MSKQGKNSTTKVNPSSPENPNQPESEEGKKGKDKKVDFKIPEGKKLTQSVPEGFDPEKHNVLKKVDFEKGAHYLQHRAFINRTRSAGLLKQAADYDKKAERMLKFKDEKTAKKVKKIERLQSTLADLTKQLSEAGIDVKEILAGVAETPAPATEAAKG